GRAEWVIAGGPEGLAAIIDQKLRPAKADYGTQLHWERGLWVWFGQLCVGHPRMVDRMAWWKTIEHEGWDADLAWRLLNVLEGTYAEAAAAEAENQTQ
ncbi:MAG TPA: hypothetical protein VIR56_02450, partial [Solimonas sp.]